MLPRRIFRQAITTVNTLTTEKEVATAGANIYDGYARGKNMAGVITKEIVNKGISTGVGKAFGVGKDAFLSVTELLNS